MINMARNIEEIIANLESLTPRDFNLQYVEANGLEQLDSLTMELADAAEPNKTVEILLGIIERLSNTEEIDPRYDLGTPGPLVHTLEKIPNYQESLIVSVRHYPTPL